MIEPERLEAVHRFQARLDAAACAAAAAFDDSGMWAVDGARNAVVWLAKRHRIPKREARRQLRLGRAVRQMTVTKGAWEAGEITSDHVQVLAPLHRGVTAGAFERDEHMLVELARTLSFDDFRRAVTYWEQLADPDGVESDAEARRRERDVYLAQSYQGSYIGRMNLDPVAGSIVGGELERREQELILAARAETKDRLGHDPLPDDLPRTPGQRRADALVEMAIRSMAAPQGGERPRPLITVLVDVPSAQRICELADGTVITPGSVVPYLEDADSRLAVFTSSRRVEVSPSSRFFSGVTREAIQIRDRRCRHPYCDAPLTRCQVDHRIPWARGGPTTQANGQLLCGFHNRLKERPPPPPFDREPPPDDNDLDFEIDPDYAGTVARCDAAEISDCRRTRPSVEPSSSSLVRSGWSMRPTTFPATLPTPAMSPVEPLGLST